MSRVGVPRRFFGWLSRPSCNTIWTIKTVSQQKNYLFVRSGRFLPFFRLVIAACPQHNLDEQSGFTAVQFGRLTQKERRPLQLGSEEDLLFSTSHARLLPGSPLLRPKLPLFDGNIYKPKLPPAKTFFIRPHLQLRKA